MHALCTVKPKSYNSSSNSQIDGHDGFAEDEVLEKVNSKDKESKSNSSICPLCPQPSGHCYCANCEEFDFFSTGEGFSIHIMNQHEPPDVYKYYSRARIEDQMQYVNRNYNYAQDRQHSEKWDSLTAV